MKENNKYELDELIHQYMDEEVEFDEIVQFCDSLEPSIENKQMLIECIDSFDIDVLYETLFSKFSFLLSHEERNKYTKRFVSIFDLALYSD